MNLNKLFIGTIGAFFNFLFLSFSFANDYEYSKMDIHADILIDGTMIINEDLDAKFNTEKHGIFRDIPLNYSVGGYNFHINIDNVNVAGKKFSTSTQNGIFSIKIGDPDITIIGNQNFPISYSTYGLIRNFSGMGYSELYWNLVGYDFDTNINSVHAELKLPKTYTGFTKDDFLITTDGDCNTIDCFGGTINWDDGNKITINYNKKLNAYNGITLAVKFPNDYFNFDHSKQEELLGKEDNNEGFFSRLTMVLGVIFGPLYGWVVDLFYLLIVGLILAIIFLPFWGLYKIKEKLKKTFSNKDFSGKIKSPIVVQYKAPEGINSAEAGILIDNFADPKDFTSLIYQWAAKGIISISGQREISLKKLINNYKFESKIEKKFFDNLFSWRKDEITIKRTTEMARMFSLKDLRKHAKDKGRSNGELQGSYLRLHIGCGLMFFLFLRIESMISYIRIPILGSVTLLIFTVLDDLTYGNNGNKIKLTENGAILQNQLLGFKEFIRACEIDKIKTFLKEDPLYIDKIIPYAVVFGLETEFIKKITPHISEMNFEENRWRMDDKTLNTFTIIRVSSLYVPKSSSGGSSYSSGGGFSGGSSFSGGGFSRGGGGGGGGGRSW